MFIVVHVSDVARGPPFFFFNENQVYMTIAYKMYLWISIVTCMIRFLLMFFFYRTEDNDIIQKSMRIIPNMYKFRQSQNA